MAEVVTMPRLSDTMEEGTVSSWLKKVGDKVEEGDILAEIEKISNRMIVINKGRKIAEGEVSQLMSSDSIKIQIKTDSNTAFENYCNTHQIAFTGENETYYLQWEESKINELIRSLNDENISLYEVKQLKTLEEYFLNLTN